MSYRMKCGYCREVFEATRPHAVYCSTKHRIYANRKGQKHKAECLDPIPARDASNGKPDLKKRRCGHCNAWYQPKREWSKFCSTKCRVYESRNGKPKAKPVTDKPKRNKAPRTKTAAKVTTNRKRNKATSTRPEFLYRIDSNYGVGDGTEVLIVHRHQLQGSKNKPFVQPWAYDVGRVHAEYVNGATFDDLGWKLGKRRKREDREYLAHRAGKWKDEGGYCQWMTERQLRNRWDRDDEPRRQQVALEAERVAMEAAKKAEQEHQLRNQRWMFKANVKVTKSFAEMIFGDSFDSGKDAFEKLKLGRHNLKAALRSLEALGLDETATDADIKRSYRKLSLKCHPDHGGSSAEFKRIRLAVEKLTGEEVLV